MKKLVISVVLAMASVMVAMGAEDGFLKGKILKIDMTEPIAEVGKGGGMFDFDIDLPIDIGIGGGSAVSLLSVELALKQAAEDKDIAMIYLNYDHFSAPVSACEEIRRYLVEFTKAGKPIVAYGTSLNNGSYYIASAADRVFLHPKGSGTLSGLSSSSYYLKDLLDTLGVEVKLIRHGKFKSAGEMYIRNSMSPENRRQTEAFLGAMWSTLASEIAESRGITVDQLNGWVDELALGTAATWVDKGLVDGLKYKDEMEQYLCHLFGTTDPNQVKRVDLKEYASKAKMGSGKKIAVLYADGEISRSGNEIAGDKFAAQVRKLREDKNVKAVVFRVNSPGGEVVAADIIRREVELLCKEKPVVASYSSYAASGGYWISVGCKKIMCDNTTITGSIGVFGLVPNLGNAMSKVLKVNMEHVGTNAHSGVGGIFKGMDETEEAWYQQEIEGIYTNFLNVVAEGRNMTPEQVDELAQGRVWAGKDAFTIGLADEKGSLLDAIDYIAGEAGLEKYKIVTYPEKSKGMFGSSKKDSKKKPLVLVENIVSEPGFKAMAIAPYMIIEL